MLLELLFNLLYGVLEFVLNFLPAINLPIEFVGGISGFMEILANVSYFLPVNTFIFAIGIWVSLHGVKQIMSVINWLIRKIPGIS